MSEVKGIEPKNQQISGNRRELNRLQDTIRLYAYSGAMYGRKESMYLDSCMRAYTLLYAQTEDVDGLVLRPGNMRYIGPNNTGPGIKECLIDLSKKPHIDGQGRIWNRLGLGGPGLELGPDHIPTGPAMEVNHD